MNGNVSNRIRRVALRGREGRLVSLLWMACWGAATSGLAGAVAEEPGAAAKKDDAPTRTAMRAKQCDLGCVCCHTCPSPTPDNKCLPACERTPADFMHDLIGPDVAILGELEKTYLPVPFDHKGHAKMAEMTKGCVVCHHYTPEGRQHPACKTCHSVDESDRSVSIRKPSLKGAYHRQCLNCHRDWIDQTDCPVCHRRKTGAPVNGEAALSPSTDDILGRMHPPIKEPSSEIYQAESKGGAKSVVIFRHWEHVQSFDLNCVDCHREENCSRCHIEQRADDQDKPPPTIKEHHQPCLRCHKVDMDESVTTISGRCKRCHWREGDPTIKPFDHANTGWPLSRYHEANSCRDCHKSVPFGKRSKECNDCHADWDPDSFDHSVTNQVLDENHKEVDCEDCHGERKFDRPPTCDECHDEDEEEAIAFPARRPGPLVRPAPARP